MYRLVMRKVREWLSEVTNGASMRSVADLLGEYNVTFTRRLDAGDARTIVRVADQYGVSPIPGLIAAEILTEDHVQTFRKKMGLNAYEDLELAEEMVERIRRASNAGDESELATVTEFPSGSGGEEYLDDIEPERYVAKRKKPEPGEGDDDYGSGA